MKLRAVPFKSTWEGGNVIFLFFCWLWGWNHICLCWVVFFSNGGGGVWNKWCPPLPGIFKWNQSLKQSHIQRTLCLKVCQWLATGRWFHPFTPISSPRHNWNIVECGAKHHKPTNQPNQRKLRLNMISELTTHVLEY